MHLAVSRFQRKLEKIYLGGGEKKIAKQHDKGKLTARERIHHLVDPDTEIFEIGAFAGDQMYEEYGGCPAGGVVVVVGRIAGRLCMIVANDATVKAGAWFPMTGKKNLRAQEIAMENRDVFIEAGGQRYGYIPCMNDDAAHIDMLAGLAGRHLQGWLTE